MERSKTIMVLPIVLYGILAVILVMLIIMSYRLPSILKLNSANNDARHEEKINTTQNFIYTGIVLVILAIVGNTYLLVKGTPRESHLMEWLNIIMRVMHFTFGIAWIGASFYFVFLENALNRTENVRDELAGNLWAVHGGGFYYLECKDLDEAIAWAAKIPGAKDGTIEIRPIVDFSQL